MSQTDPLIIKLENVRLSFPALHHKTAMKGKDAAKEGSYKANFLLHKTKNAASIKKLQEAIAKLVKDEFNGKALEPQNVCLREASLKEYDGYDAEHLVLSATNSKTKPALVDNKLQQIAEGDTADPYPGCYVDATIKLYAQNGKTYKPDPTWGKKINATLRGVLVRTAQGRPYGEPFGDRVDVEKELTAVPDADTADEV